MPTLSINQPLANAVAQMAWRRIVPSGMTSREWELIQAEIRLRSMFSSMVEHERTLTEMLDRLKAGIGSEKRDGATMDRGRFIEEMRGIIRENGYKRPDGVHKDSVRNLKSRARLGLIWDMNMAQARGYAQWKAAMDPGMLKASPCWELIRVKQRVEIREWPLVWHDHGGQFYGAPGKDYPRAKGRMIATKIDDIWKFISRFKTPWPPFDWGSGMGLRPIVRAEAIALGVITEDTVLTPLSLPFNTGTEASLAGIPQDRRTAIADALAGDVVIVGDKIRITPPPDEMGGPSRKVIAPRFHPIDQPAPAPDGTPLAEVLTIDQDRRNAAVIREIHKGIALMDDVHGDGVLPPLQVELHVPVCRENIAGSYQSVTSRDQTPVLLINPNAIDPAFTLLHEGGHYMDNLGLHTPTEARRYASEGQPDLDGIMREIIRSTAAARLSAALPPNSALLSSRELFARAYAQYIAEQSGDAALWETIRLIRRGELRDSKLLPNSQWTWLDFNPISRAFKNLFHKLGWTNDL